MEELLDYERFIYSIINKYPKRFDKDDLYQVAMMGLMKAYQHFDSNHDTKFSSFAYYYIIGEVNQYIRQSSSLKVSKEIIAVKKKILQAREVMSQKLGRVPTNLEISLFLEIDERVVEDALIATEEVDSIDNCSGGIYDDICTKPEILDLKIEIDKLSDDEKNLIIARYYNEMTQQEASKVLGISQVQVSRKESKILQKLKTRL